MFENSNANSNATETREVSLTPVTQEEAIDCLGSAQYNAMSDEQRQAAAGVTWEQVKGADAERLSRFFGSRSDSAAAHRLGKANPLLYRLLKKRSRELGLI